jgi:hypothetical protein
LDEVDDLLCPGRKALRGARVSFALQDVWRFVSPIFALIAFGKGAAEIESGISAAAAGAGTLAENHMFTEI